MYLTDNGMQCNYSDKTFIAVQNNPSAFTSVRFSSAICSTDKDGLIDRYCSFVLFCFLMVKMKMLKC